MVADPEAFFSNLLDYITAFMLIMMPIFAFIQSIAYLTARGYYVEHFILTLHNQTFLILAFALISIMGFIQDLAIPLVSTSFDCLSTLLGFWMVIYLFLSLKYFFHQTYLITTIKFSLLGLSIAFA